MKINIRLKIYLKNDIEVITDSLDMRTEDVTYLSYANEYQSHGTVKISEIIKIEPIVNGK